MKRLFITTHSEMSRVTVPWLTEALENDEELLVTNCILNPVAVPGRIQAWPMIEDSQKVRDVLEEQIDQLKDKNITLIDPVEGEFPADEVAEIVIKRQIDVVYFPVDTRLGLGDPDMQFGQRLLRNSLCNVVLLDLGENERGSIKRFVVPLDLAASGHVIKYMMRFGDKLGKTILLHVSPDFGADSETIASKELELQLKEVGMEEHSELVIPKLVMADSFHQGIVQTVKANDAIILAGTSIKMMHDLRKQLFHLRPNIADKIAVGIFRPVELAAKTRFGQFVQRLKGTLPELTLTDRVSLFDRIQGGARLTPDYIAMIGLSVLIASFGLLADNPSVVIGAMLVAPFMTPLIGVGLALAQGNIVLMKRSLLATGAGILVGVSLSFIIGMLVPLSELPLEILARGDPDIVDMAIAFVSGMAAAYAVSRESVSESIVGVAIAAALVPPLSCVGIMFANRKILETEGAIVLLVTNLAAIALGAAFIFRRLGVPGTRTGYHSYKKIRWISMVMVLLLLCLSVPLVFRMANQLAVGQTRPMSFRVSPKVKQLVEERIDKTEGVTIMFMGRSGSGHSKLVRVLLNADEPVPESIIKAVKADIKSILGEKTPVEIGVFQNAIISKPKVTAKITEED